MKFKKIGLVLGGGGGKGSYQVGVFKALKEQGLTDKITCISGTSIGALNLTLFASQDVEKAEEIWNGLARKDVLTAKKIREYLNFKNFSVFSRKGMENIFEAVDLKAVSNSKLDLFVCATDKEADKPKYFKLNGQSEEKILQIIMASSAIPNVFENTVIDGVKYFDGYKFDNVPVNCLRELGCDLLYVIPLSGFLSPKSGQYNDVTIINFKDDIFDSVKIWEGTLGFDGELAKQRIEQGYKNATMLINYLRKEHIIATTLKERFIAWFALKTKKGKQSIQKYYSIDDVKTF